LRLDEGDGTTAFDSADNLNGEYRGGFTLGADGPIGNGAVGFDGSSGYVFIPHQDQLQLSSGAFEVWFTPDSDTGDHTLFAKNSSGQGSGGQVAMLVRDGNAFAALGDLETNHSIVGDDPDGPTIQAGVPAQMVFNFGAQGMELYLNGQLVGTHPHTGGLTGNSEALVLGAENGTNESGTPIDEPGDLVRFFDGVIDEFVIYDQALSQADVQQLFEAGQRGLDLVGTSDDDRLIGGLDDEILRGLAGSDRLSGAGGDDVLRGGGSADNLLGGPGNDRLFGGSGDDDLRGGAGEDALRGQGGADRLRGGAGDDLLNGGNGSDVLRGGGGGDLFQIDRISHGVDRIRDFDPREGDVLDLSSVVDFQSGDALDDFVQFAEIDSDTRVDVNPDGAGAGFTAVFNLVNTASLDLEALVASGNVRLTSPDS
jgi:Ca2+-binding RTX toxin-like protein